MTSPHLHLTHGESANARLRDAGLPGVFAGWDDVLHEGPIPEGLDLDALSTLRARFLSDRGWGSLEEIQERLTNRNRVLREHAAGGEVIVWLTFELFDQLQLWQILDWFARRETVAKAPFLIRLSGYFHEQPRAELRNWFLGRERCGAEEVQRGSELWQCFCAAEPSALARRLDDAAGQLPFELQSIQRLLEEYPDARTGLSRTERQILVQLADGEASPGELFRGSQKAEAPAFMGDWSFWHVLGGLVNRGQPAVVGLERRPFTHPPQVAVDSPRFRDQRLRLSAFGEQLLAGEGDFVARNGIDRWIGGVHLQPENDWRWNGETVELKR